MSEGTCFQINHRVFFKEQLWAPWTHKPRNGLLRALFGFQKVLRRPVRGFRVQGAQKCSSFRATEGTLNTQTLERASKNPVLSPEGS